MILLKDILKNPRVILFFVNVYHFTVVDKVLISKFRYFESFISPLLPETIPSALILDHIALVNSHWE